MSENMVFRQSQQTRVADLQERSPLSLGLFPKMIIQKLCCYAVALPDIEEAWDG